MHKKILFRTLFSILVLLSSDFVFGQPWMEKIQTESSGKTLSFFDYQKAFNDYWDPKNVGTDGFYLENGERKKAYGWKQFRRWEYNMQYKADLQTGFLPPNSAQQIYERYIASLPVESRATNANWSSMGTSSSSGGYAGIGRLNCVAFHPTNSNIYWVGAPAGGLWLTTNDGSSWSCLTDNNNVMGVSDIAVTSDYSTSNTIYIATGDRDASDNYSIGVLKSTNAGSTWNSTSLSFSLSSGKMVNRLLIDPNNNQILVAATSGGVYKTTNGGSNWTFLSSNNFIDLEYKPDNFNTLYGSTKTGAIWYSTNGGSNWIQSLNLTSGRRVELAVSPNQTTFVYAVVAGTDNGLYGVYKSSNSGTSFSQVFSGSTLNLLGWNSNGGDSGGQGWYDLAIAASPSDANTVLVGGVNTWRSTNGGTTWTIVNHWTGSGAPAVHADKHNLKYRSDGHLYECNDGGLYKSTNNGTNWTDKSNGLVISQMYKLGVSQTVSTEVITGLQDNGTKLRSGSTWSDVIGGDGMECLINYTNVNIQYGSLYYGDIKRTTNHWQSSSTITPSSAGSGAWVTPYIIDPVNQSTLYSGYGDIWKSTNQGTNWTKISNISSSDKIRSMAIAPSNVQVIYCADRTHIYKTTNGGGAWTNITGSLPVSSSYITAIAVNSNDPSTVWVTFSHYNSNRVYQSTNGGSTWTSISTGLPQLPVYSIAQNKQITAEVQLYVGTEIGIYFKKGADNWIPFNTGLPNVQIGEIEIYYNNTSPDLSKLRAATYGRGLWESFVYYNSNGVSIPVNVQASDGTYSDKVFVSWNGTAGNYFLVYRNTTNSSSSATAVGNWQTATNFSDLTAVPNTTYYYWVKAASDVNGTNSSAFSTSDSGWKSQVTIPVNVQASDGTYSDKVLISWSGTPGNYFRVYRNTTNNSGTATALDSWQTSMTFNDFSATVNVTYYYWVKAALDVNGSSSSGFSVADTGWKSEIALPTNVQASDGTYSDKVFVTWSGTTGNYFRVYRNTTNNSGTATALGSWQTSMTYNDFSATVNVTYYYWVKSSASSNGSNPSTFSTPNTGFRSGVTIPTNVQASDGTYNNRVRVTWSGTSGNYFRVYRNTTSNSGTATALGSWQTSMTYNDYSAAVNVIYYYWVKSSASSNGSNPSAFSTPNTGWRSGSIAPPQEDIIATETENKLEFDLYTYPNPVKPATEFDLKCNLSLESVHSVKIVDLNGKVVYESVLNAIETKDNIKLLSPDKQGMYLLFLKMIDGNVLYSKIVVY
ncbi:MAG: T9SS type A sorting domain-containing protein [Saprospiraceae bacterium]|nr:T9SS type A sorting domain-containing protein [Saprospiraceae bacterium]